MRDGGRFGFSVRLAGLKMYSARMPRSFTARSLNPYIQIQPLMSNLFVVLGKHLQGMEAIHLSEGDNGILGEGGGGDFDGILEGLGESSAALPSALLEFHYDFSVCDACPYSVKRRINTPRASANWPIIVAISLVRGTTIYLAAVLMGTTIVSPGSTFFIFSQLVSAEPSALRR
jgi:hypothetical protein